MDKNLQIIPHLSFNGNCEEAIATYINAFGGEILFMSRWSEDTYDKTSRQIGKVMHAEFMLGSTRMAASDAFTGNAPGAEVKFMIHMASKPDALHAVSLLADGGNVISPLKPHPKPDDGGCGSITRDKFGYTWIITCPNPDRT